MFVCLFIELAKRPSRCLVWPQLEAQREESLPQSLIITSFRVQGTQQTPTCLKKDMNKNGLYVQVKVKVSEGEGDISRGKKR